MTCILSSSFQAAYLLWNMRKFKKNNNNNKKKTAPKNTAQIKKYSKTRHIKPHYSTSIQYSEQFFSSRIFITKYEEIKIKSITIVDGGVWSPFIFHPSPVISKFKNHPGIKIIIFQINPNKRFSFCSVLHKEILKHTEKSRHWNSNIAKHTNKIVKAKLLFLLKSLP